MPVVEKSIDVNVPLKTAYEQWIKFEEFPQFMEGVQEVKRLDDTHFLWRVGLAGKTEEWDAKLIEQTPHQRIVWQSNNGTIKQGVVTFESISDTKTRVKAHMTYDPEGFIENVGDLLGFVSHRLEGDLKQFQNLIERRWTKTNPS